MDRRKLLATDIVTRGFTIFQVFITAFILQTWKLRHKTLIVSWES